MSKIIGLTLFLMFFLMDCSPVVGFAAITSKHNENIITMPRATYYPWTESRRLREGFGRP